MKRKLIRERAKIIKKFANVFAEDPEIIAILDEKYFFNEDFLHVRAKQNQKKNLNV